MDHTACHTARAFLEALEDLSQYLASQKDMGNTSLRLTEPAGKTIEQWGTPAWSSPAFSALGPETARILVVDSQGTFFDGPAGELLVKILKAMRLAKHQVYICNTAAPEQIRGHVVRNRPQAIVALGEKAGRILLNTQDNLGALRGKFNTFSNTQLMVTHHPADLLENPGLKRQVWDDMQMVMKQAGL